MGTIVKERPILFSGPMVRALLAGTKTQTRRAVKPQPIEAIRGRHGDFIDVGAIVPLEGGGALHHLGKRVRCPYGRPGERLWVREAWNVFALTKDLESNAPFHAIPTFDPREDEDYLGNSCVDYPVCSLPGHDGGKGPWRPSIHMPRWASRIMLEIVSVRVERLQDISEADAVAEGVIERYFYGGHQSPGHVEWESVQPPRGDGKQRPLGTYADYSGGRAHLKPIESYASLWQKINGPESWAANPWVWVVEFKVIAPAPTPIQETTQN